LVKKNKTLRQKQEQRRFWRLLKAVRERGFDIRCEQLPCGTAYRAKSGNCVVSGRDVVFVDKRLPIKLQMSVLVDFMKDLKIDLTSEEAALIPGTLRRLFGVNGHANANGLVSQVIEEGKLPQQDTN